MKPHSVDDRKARDSLSPLSNHRPKGIGKSLAPSLPFRARIIVLLAWVLKAVRMIGTRDYEHLKFNLWFEADLKARGMKVTNVTPNVENSGRRWIP